MPLNTADAFTASAAAGSATAMAITVRVSTRRWSIMGWVGLYIGDSLVSGSVAGTLRR